MKMINIDDVEQKLIKKNFEIDIKRASSGKVVSQITAMIGNDLSKIRSPKDKSDAGPVRREHSCPNCPAKFKRLAALTGHIKNVHQEVENKSQASAGIDSDLSQGGSQIVKSEVESVGRVYCCPNCPAKLSKIKDYREHMKSIHSISFGQLNSTYHDVNETKSLSVISKLPEYQVFPNSLICPNCSKTFLKVGSFRRHLRSHLNLPSYSCRHCVEKNFFEKEQLLVHIREEHQGEKNIKCHECDELFYHKTAFVQHLSIHIKSPPYKCNMCEGIFSTPNHLVRHKMFHTHICPVCEKLFPSRQNIVNHIQIDHRESDIVGFINEPEYKSYKIKNGQKSDDNFDELEIGWSADSYTSDDSAIADIKIKQEKKKTKRRPCIVCFICERRFPTQKHLDFHMKYHLIFLCKRCPKFFGDETSLVAHEIEHFKKKAKKY